MLLDDDWCAFLKQHNFLVGLSVDGPQEIHDTYRVNKGGQGTFKQVMRGWETKARYIADRLQGIPGVVAEVAVNTAGFVDVDLTWDQRVIALSAQEVKDRLKQGDPSLIYDGTTVRTRCLEDGEERLVAERLRMFFTNEARRKA